jgi:hypothetical protein
MSITLVNLALPIVTDEIEVTLDTYPEDPYQKAFAIPELREKLIAYVLSTIPSSYTVVEDAQPGIAYPKFPYRSLELRLHIENQIHNGIKYILQSNFDWIIHHIPPEAYPGNVPSDWFG